MIIPPPPKKTSLLPRTPDSHLIFLLRGFDVCGGSLQLASILPPPRPPAADTVHCSARVSFRFLESGGVLAQASILYSNSPPGSLSSCYIQYHVCMFAVINIYGCLLLFTALLIPQGVPWSVTQLFFSFLSTRFVNVFIMFVVT